MVCVPAAKFIVENCAEPAPKATEPICDCASRNETVPVGVPEPDCGATLAVNVMFEPEVFWVAEADSEVVVLIFAGAETVSEIAADVEVAKVESPE
jgi:hypothetical protein